MCYVHKVVRKKRIFVRFFKNFQVFLNFHQEEEEPYRGVFLCEKSIARNLPKLENYSLIAIDFLHGTTHIRVTWVKI